jgi:hypothetical protein
MGSTSGIRPGGGFNATREMEIYRQTVKSRKL